MISCGYFSVWSPVNITGKDSRANAENSGICNRSRDIQRTVTGQYSKVNTVQCSTSRLHSQHANKITKLIRGMYYRSVSTVSRIRAGRCGVRIPAKARNVFLLQVVLASALCLVLNRYGVHSRRVQRPRRNNDDTCPPSAEVNNEWRYTYTPPMTSILCFPLSVAFHQWPRYSVFPCQ